MNTIAWQSDGQVHDVNLLAAILLKMLNHLANPGVILQDAHSFALSEERLPWDGFIIGILLEKRKDVIGTLNLLLIVS